MGPKHYAALAVILAAKGIPVAIPKFSRHVGFHDATHPNEARRTTIIRTMDDLSRRIGFQTIRLAGHSFGGANISKVPEKSDHSVARMDFISSAGFGGAPGGFRTALNAIIHEGHYMITHPLDELRLAVDTADYLRENPALAVTELMAILQLSIEDIVAGAVKNQIACRIHTAKKDRVLPAERTEAVASSIVGAENVRRFPDENADHLAAQRLPEMVANALLEP